MEVKWNCGREVYSYGIEWRPVVGRCGHGNEPSGFRAKLNDC
jgi:hypothetical protein